MCTCTVSPTGCNLPGENINGSMDHPGDIIIGGTFRVHFDRVYNSLPFTSKPPELQCQMVAIEFYQTMHALIFAVDEINSNSELLPNITLGFQVYDTCNTLRHTAQATLSMLSGGNEITPNYHCQKGTHLASIVGDSASTRSILMAQMLGLLRFPQISYFSTNPILSDRHQFPSFFRTIPSDEFQMKGLAQLVSHFGWSWLGVLANDDDYGQSGLQMLKQELMKTGACLSFVGSILTSKADKNAPYLVQVIRKSMAKVVIVISSDSHFVFVVEELLKQNVTGHVWIASEAWASSDLLSNERFKGILVGTLGIAIYHGQMPKFSKYFNSLNPSNVLDDIFIQEIWEKTFSCKWLSRNNLLTQKDNSTIACTGNETLENLLTDDHRLSLNVHTAVNAIAWALHNMMHCKPEGGPFYKGACANISSFYPWQLLYYIKNVSFKTGDGRQIYFDAKGNPPIMYDIVNWKISAEGTLEQGTIGTYGTYDLNTPDRQTLNINGKIVWINNSTQAPLAKCSPSCPSGFRKVIIPGKPLCCYECARCPQGHISNHTDAVECHPCAWDMWPNQEQDRCLPRTTELLSYEEPLGYSLVAISVLSCLIPMIILGVFICFKNTPVVRANNYSLSCLLLVSLFLCFLCSLGFIGYPQTEKCLLRQVAFGMVSALCISCVLVKTIIVVGAFKATKPGSRLRMWTGVRVSYSTIGISIFIQLCVCVMWLIFSPPFPEIDIDIKPGFIILNCNEGSSAAFWCMLGYLGLLATISFIVAFLARKLPDSFNEAKLITFSMLAFLSVWVSFIPAYLSARGIYTTAMEVFAILTSSWAMVICIFVPKCFIVLLRPNKNSKEHLLGKIKMKI